MKNKRVLGVLLALCGASFYGLMPLFTKTAYSYGLTAYTVVTLRFGVGALVLALLHLIIPGWSLKIPGKQFLVLLGVALPGAITPLLLFSSYNYIDSGLATTVHFINPIVVMLLEVFFCRKKLPLIKWLLAALALGGVVLFYVPGGSVNATGLLLAAASGLTFGLYVFLIGRSSIKELNNFTVCCYFAAISAVIITIAGCAVGQLSFRVPVPGLLAGAELAMVGTVVGFSLFALGVRLCGDVNASLAGTMEPLVSILVGVLVFGEILNARSVAGIVCILAASVALVLVKEKPKA